MEREAGSGVGSHVHVTGLHGLALGGGDGVLDRGAVHLGHGVAVLHLHRHQLDLGTFSGPSGSSIPAAS